MTYPCKPKFDFNQSVFEITINPDQKHQYFGCDIRNLKSRNDITDVFHKMPYIKYWLFQEISIQQHSNKDLPQNRIHYHGIIEVTDHFNFALTGMYYLTRMGDYQLNNYRPTGEFMEYAKKQRWMYKTAKQRQMIANAESSYFRALLSLDKPVPDESGEGAKGDGSSPL